MLKVSRGLNSELVNDLFKFREQIPYELRQRPQFQIPLVHSVFSGTESLKFPPSKIWTMVPNEMKQLESLQKTMETMENNGNLDPVLADYIRRIRFFNKKLFQQMTTFSFAST